MRHLFCYVLLCGLSVAGAQQGPTAPRSGNKTSHPSPGLAVEGLENEQMWRDFYTGNFADIRYHRDDQIFKLLYVSDLETFSSECPSALPRNKVEMTRQECARFSHPSNDNGGRIGPDSCVYKIQVRTGLYADPAMYAAKIKIDEDTAGNLSSTTPKMMSNTAQGHGFDIAAEGQSIKSDLAAGQSIKSDLAALMKNNACSGSAMKRFQRNLMLFALGKPPLPPTRPAANSSQGGLVQQHKLQQIPQ